MEVDLRFRFEALSLEDFRRFEAWGLGLGFRFRV